MSKEHYAAMDNFYAKVNNWTKEFKNIEEVVAFIEEGIRSGIVYTDMIDKARGVVDVLKDMVDVSKEPAKLKYTSPECVGQRKRANNFIDFAKGLEDDENFYESNQEAKVSAEYLELIATEEACAIREERGDCDERCLIEDVLKEAIG